MNAFVIAPRIPTTLGDDRAIKARYILGRRVHGGPAAIHAPMYTERVPS